MSDRTFITKRGITTTTETNEKENVKITIIVATILCLTHNLSAQVEGWLSAAYMNPAHVRVTTNAIIAKYAVTAGAESVRLTQLALGVAASGAWINEQVRNVRLLTGIVSSEHIAGPERVWSTPILCDCDSGRVFFDNISNLVIEAYTTRIITVIADVHGISGQVIVTYSHGDSRIIGEASQVNSTLYAVQNVDSDKFQGVYIQLPTVPSDYAHIDMFQLRIMDGTNSKSLFLHGTIEPHTTYSVEASTNLVHWEEVGMANDPGDSEILKEHVGTVPVAYSKMAFFRLRKIVP